MAIKRVIYSDPPEFPGWYQWRDGCARYITTWVLKLLKAFDSVRNRAHKSVLPKLCMGCGAWSVLELQGAQRNSHWPEAWLFLNPPYLLAPIISCDLRPYIQKTCLCVCVLMCVNMCAHLWDARAILRHTHTHIYKYVKHIAAKQR